MKSQSHGESGQRYKHLKDTERLDRCDESPGRCSIKPALRAQGQRYVQMVAHLPPSYHTTEHIHKDGNIDEASFESDVGYIANPDPITSTDVKCFEAIYPRR